jgi:hypothetical protein
MDAMTRSRLLSLATVTLREARCYGCYGACQSGRIKAVTPAVTP